MNQASVMPAIEFGRFKILPHRRELLADGRLVELGERGEDRLLNIDAIAEAYWQIHRQARSVWTHEIDLRPFKEPF